MIFYSLTTNFIIYEEKLKYIHIYRTWIRKLFFLLSAQSFIWTLIRYVCERIVSAGIIDKSVGFMYKYINRVKINKYEIRRSCVREKSSWGGFTTTMFRLVIENQINVTFILVARLKKSSKSSNVNSSRKTSLLLQLICLYYYFYY